MHQTARVLAIGIILLASLPLITSAAACSPTPLKCTTGEQQYAVPTSSDCPTGGFVCKKVGTTQGGAAAAAPRSVSSATLALGSRGSAVLALQEKLISLNFLSSDSNTSYFGPRTQAALRAFQSAQGIEAVGFAGPRTKAALTAATPTSNAATPFGTSQASPSQPSNTTSIASLLALLKSLQDQIAAIKNGTASPANTTTNSSQATNTQPTITNNDAGGVATASALSYSWTTGGWGACSNVSQSRSVSCTSSTNTFVSDTSCTSSRPAAWQSCTVAVTPPQSCTFTPGGQATQTVAHGASVLAYQSSSVPAGQQCLQEQRTCTNGNLSGSYTNTSCSVGTQIPSVEQRTIAGSLDHVSIAWIEGFACDPNDHAAPVSIEIYASGVVGDGTSASYAGGTVYRVATAIANKNAAGRSSQCGGNAQTGFHIPTPSAILDRQNHTVVVFAKNIKSGSKTELTGAVSFNSSILYSQEPIYEIDDHILVSHSLANSPAARAESNFYANHHTLFVIYPPTGTNPFSTPISCEASWATGLHASGSLVNKIRGPLSRTSCPGGQQSFMAAIADGERLGFINSSVDFGRYDAGVFIQHNWNPFQNVFRSGYENDKLRISGIFRQPYKFSDPTTSPDAMNFWYYVLNFKGPSKNIWFTVPVYYSRTAGSDTWRRYSDGTSDFTFEEGNEVYVNAPLKQGATWITPCAGTSLFYREAYQDERTFCFELSASQLRTALNDYAKSHPGIDTDPSKYLLQFFLVNSEAWGVGGPNSIALSMRDLRVQSIFAAQPSAPPPPPPPPPPPAAENNVRPRGFIDVVSCSSISGWAQDTDIPDEPISVHVYIDNIFAGGLKASAPRGDLCTVIGSCNHAFSMPTPTQYLDGKAHTVFIGAIDNGGPNNFNSPLDGPNKSFTCI